MTNADAAQEAQMVAGYLAGFSGEPPPPRMTAAYRHGWMNGLADRTGRVIENADVLRRRAAMILNTRGRP